ncbi:MAG: HAD hydrolase-like protein [Lactobacillales bacterium]|jgi:phosphoglycolate phosphatase-like HAD superfamily hydrolase|nr:HAD hydrolase-like protein [Lactobacillales bacterium]
MKNLIWDLDGTLIDSYDVILDSLEAILASRGVNAERAEIERQIKATSTVQFLKSLPIYYAEAKAEFSRKTNLKIKDFC